MIPKWSHDGLIPPVNEASPASQDRSPYETNVASLTDRFGFNLDRCQILQGYLSHRGELHSMGLTEGFQWINGSFTENIEAIEGRHPNDIDVVTFLPQEISILESLDPDQMRLLTDQPWIKDQYKVDFYVQSLRDDPEALVSMCTYWYSMWSHRRSMQWKGFLKIPLDPANDTRAGEVLSARILELSHEQE